MSFNISSNITQIFSTIGMENNRYIAAIPSVTVAALFLSARLSVATIGGSFKVASYVADFFEDDDLSDNLNEFGDECISLAQRNMVIDLKCTLSVSGLSALAVCIHKFVELHSYQCPFFPKTPKDEGVVSAVSDILNWIRLQKRW